MAKLGQRRAVVESNPGLHLVMVNAVARNQHRTDSMDTLTLVRDPACPFVLDRKTMQDHLAACRAGTIHSSALNVLG